MQRDHPYSRTARSCVRDEDEQNRPTDSHCRGSPCRYYRKYRIVTLDEFHEEFFEIENITLSKMYIF